MLPDPQHNDMHRTIWTLSTIGAVGGGLAVFYGIVRWLMSMYRKGCALVQRIDSIPELNQAAIKRADDASKRLADVKSAVDHVSANHLTHIEEDIRDGRKEQTELLRNMDTNIKILVDRGARL
jgi:hypothetical protein